MFTSADKCMLHVDSRTKSQTIVDIIVQKLKVNMIFNIEWTLTLDSSLQLSFGLQKTFHGTSQHGTLFPHDYAFSHHHRRIKHNIPPLSTAHQAHHALIFRPRVECLPWFNCDQNLPGNVLHPLPSKRESLIYPLPRHLVTSLMIWLMMMRYSHCSCLL